MRGFKFSGGPLREGLMVFLMAAVAVTTPVRAQAPADVSYLDQGWSDTDRSTFYTTGQGSHIMPYAWFKALRQKDADQPFKADQLSRYGYIRNDSPENTEALPVGFVIDSTAKPPQIGMTCAACHTGQLEYQKDGATHAIRLDGAPALSDFQQFLSDLRDTADATLAQPARFAAFAGAVPAAVTPPAALKAQFAAWVKQFDEFMKLSLPTTPWGPGRLDAFGMIFNRVTARDLGVIGNFKIADAPVSYPFLWNAHRQDHTQWNGGVPNGLFITALARNAGEVFGVFADFKPSIRQPQIGPVRIINYRVNSVQFTGLQTLEEKIATLKAPPWPKQFKVPDPEMVAKGQALFDAKCGQCHNEHASALPNVWATPIKAVGTDPKMAANADSKASPGIYAGSVLPPPSIGKTFAACTVASGPNCAADVELLASTVVGALLDDAFNKTTLLSHDRMAKSGVLQALDMDREAVLSGEKVESLTGPSVDHVAEITSIIRSKLGHMYANQTPGAPAAAYESRVLHGIWATAPYLHNGSVPNLWELLTPPAQRKTTFMVGSRLFDEKNVGYSTADSPFKSGTFVVDPGKGNGNGGHDFGTGLSDDEKWQIIEYMKTL